VAVSDPAVVRPIAASRTLVIGGIIKSGRFPDGYRRKSPPVHPIPSKNRWRYKYTVCSCFSRPAGLLSFPRRWESRINVTEPALVFFLRGFPRPAGRGQACAGKTNQFLATVFPARGIGFQQPIDTFYSFPAYIITECPDRFSAGTVPSKEGNLHGRGRSL